MEEDLKTINITGTYNKYNMKKFINKEYKKEPKKRIISEKWTFYNNKIFEDNQLKIINDIFASKNDPKQNDPKQNDPKQNDPKQNDNVIKTAIQEINKKISSYKQQDILKKKFDLTKFIVFDSIIEKMISCELKCYYCKDDMNVLYDISRESKQWTVDRINNDLGHNIDNYHLACLDCNLKRRCKTDKKFLFTKQLNIIKQDITPLHI
jgi:hypothetical protein